MCGIAGIFHYNAIRPVDEAELIRVRDWMASRGPDGAGKWCSADNRVGLAHRRLAIIDLSESGVQPMIDTDTGNVIVFNGEIYNYRELRKELESRGCRFRSTSDTEVLLHLYAEKGDAMMDDLRGMYAFAIWDARRKGLFLARDPFGIKPLYIADDGKTLRIASQVRALLAGGNIDTSPEPAGHVGFFLWGHIPDPYTLYRGIRALPAGCCLWIPQESRSFASSPRTFCSIAELIRHAEDVCLSAGGKEHSSSLRDALLDTVNHHLIADVPVGMFLSSGIDSATLTALVSERIRDQLHTVTLGFREYAGTDDDEVPLAELVAKQYGTLHQTVWVEKDDFQAELEHLLRAMDQPSIDGVNTYFVSKAAVQAGLKVVISGLGGDEIFGSYPSFRQVPGMVSLFRPFSRPGLLGRSFRVATAPLLKHFTSPKYAGLLEYGHTYGGAYLLRRGMFMPWELPDILDGDMVREGWRELRILERLNETAGTVNNAYLKVSALELSWYMRNQLLRDTDWASMAHSLEIRVPLVDLRLLSYVFGNRSSSVTRHASTTGASGIAPLSKLDFAASPARVLPTGVVTRPKTGFVVPVREWLGSRNHHGLRNWALNIYNESKKWSGA